MSQISINPNALDLMYLAHCALNGQKPLADRLRNMHPKELYLMGDMHSLNALISFAMEGNMPAAACASWINARETSLRRNILLDKEGSVICKTMDEKGIWYMRLKGSILKDLYPKMEMRQMTDQDILFDTTRRAEMREFMLARGYDPKGHSDTHHDIYHKDPMYNFELHHTLFELHCDLRMVDYYRDVKEERMIPNNDGTMGFHFSDEDFYIYMVAHAYKHYTDRGVGLRSLVDVYVFDSNKPNLDWDYVERECRKLGIDVYERTCRQAARKLLGDNAPQTLTEDEVEMVRFCTIAGTHGNEEAFISHELQSSGGKVTFGQKVKYIWKRLFPSPKWMRENERLVRRHPWLLPVGWIVRLFRGIFKKGGHTTNELRYVMGTEEVE